MKKLGTVLIGAGLLVSSLAPPVHGMASKPKPTRTTLYFHGETPAGEAEFPQDQVDNTFMSMDTQKPAGSVPKSKHLGWSNTQCAGNRLFVTWLGKVAGRIGDVKVVFTSVSQPQDVDIRIWTDVDGQWCNNDYPNPQAQKTVTLPAGQGEVSVSLPGASFPALGSMMVQISPSPSLGTDTPGPGRILYDSPSAPSRVEFRCIPAKGKACV